MGAKRRNLTGRAKATTAVVETETSGEQAQLKPRSSSATSILLFCALVLLYTQGGHAPLEVNNDVRANIWMPIAVLKHGKLSYDHINFPFWFRWVGARAPTPFPGFARQPLPLGSPFPSQVVALGRS